MGYQIRPALDADLPHLPSIELAASKLFANTDFAQETSYCSLTTESLRSRLNRGGLWVAAFEELPVGFVVVIEIDGNAHIDELDVHPSHQRNGLGRQLVEAVCSWANANGHRAVTLSTYANIPWNGPFYRRLGFEEINHEDATEGYRRLRETEARLGLSIDHRVIMRRPLAGDQEKA